MLEPAQVERVLAKLGFTAPPTNDLPGLEALYGRWCRKVPFDNLQKRLALSLNQPGPLPGTGADAFFRDWLAYGTGGTCWAVSGALHDLLAALGFQVTRATCTMLSAPGVHGPNHGSVLARVEGNEYLVDGSVLSELPIRVEEHDGEAQPHPGARVRVALRDGGWQVFWRPLHLLDGIWCRIELSDVPDVVFAQLYESTRAWGPFNYSVYARINTETSQSGLAFGNRVTIEPDGQARSEPVSHQERTRFLVEDLGIAEELVARLPVDEPMPPRPTA